ncbi:hypothetical protein G9A89_023398 [Geosiphon pyriformis]|nr:hypothetical protein G9A89_023398 [Geosiphon pyriformis]
MVQTYHFGLIIKFFSGQDGKIWQDLETETRVKILSIGDKSFNISFKPSKPQVIFPVSSLKLDLPRQKATVILSEALAIENEKLKSNIYKFMHAKREKQANKPRRTNIPYLFYKELAEITNYAYCGISPNVEITHEGQIGLHLSKYFSNIPATVLVYSKKQRIIVNFKGPEYIREQWMRHSETSTMDLIQYTNDTPTSIEAFVDTQFYNPVELELPQITDGIDKAIKKYPEIFKIAPVIFIGHGIGGAYASLAGLSYHFQSSKRKNHPARLRVITFGQPRVGLEMYATLVNVYLEVTRVTHTNDWVPRLFLPPPYMHHEEEFWITTADCNCIGNNNARKTAPMPDGFITLSCKGYHIKAVNRFGENPDCNLSTKDSEDGQNLAHYGPYFGVTMKQCVTN